MSTTSAVHWLIQANQRDALAVSGTCEALDDMGTPWHLVTLQPFAPEIPPVPALPAGVPVVCYGPGFVPRTLNHPHLRPGIFFDDAAFRWSAFQTHWAELMLSQDGRVLPLGEALEVLARLAPGERRFVRPDEDSKAFDGGLHDHASLAAATAKARVTPATPVVLASPTPVDAEWRTFVVGGEVVAASVYRREGRPAAQGYVPDAVIDLALESVRRWAPASAVCVDMARSGERYGVVEANCINAARFYAANGRRILQALTEHAAALCGPYEM